MILTGETEVLGDESVSVPFCPLLISYRPTPRSKLGLRSERPETNRLSHGTACVYPTVFPL
jgi:hypothetical protein